MPGSDSTSVVDISSIGTLGIVDISGSTGTFRANTTGSYTGNFPTFADATHVYSYDNYTTGAEFYRYSVDANGLTLIDGTTLNGMGGFSGSFKLSTGLVFGASGGVIDPSTTPPSQLALLSLPGSPGYSVAADKTLGKDFLITNLQNYGNGFLLNRYDLNRYTLEASLALPYSQYSSSQSFNLYRWGQDGLVYLTTSVDYSTYPSTTKTQLILMRGPFVLPSELRRKRGALTLQCKPNHAHPEWRQYRPHSHRQWIYARRRRTLGRTSSAPPIMSTRNM